MATFATYPKLFSLAPSDPSRAATRTRTVKFGGSVVARLPGSTIKRTCLPPTQPITRLRSVKNTASTASKFPDPAQSDMGELPGDPSLIVHTNVTIDPAKKKAFMKAMSTAIASTLSKPESYVAVLVMDGLDLIWAGEDTPCALASLTSLGAITPDNNAAFSATFADAVAELGIPKNRYYITFTDVPRSNMGYNGATF